MSKLFIIGNGFDLGHKLETSYDDFKIFLIIQIFQEEYKKGKQNFLKEFYNQCDDYLRLCYPGETLSRNEINSIFEENSIKKITKLMKETLWECFCAFYSNIYFQDYLENESNWSKYFINLIEVVYYWQDFESSLGKLYLGVDSNYSDIFIKSDHGEAKRSMDENREIQIKMFELLEELDISFRNWINLVDVNKANKLETFGKEINDETLFFTFNYTNTLEEVYNVQSNNILHIHGKVGEKIIYGHEGFEVLSEKDEYLKRCESKQTTDGEAVYELDESLRKKTEKIINKKEVKDFFEKIKNVDEVYSYGFSYAKVDEIYIEEIIKKVNGKDVTWYLDDYNNEINLNYKKIIENLGFKGKIKEFSRN
ncbi:AbiH family protein [Fusobacterium sp. MFO224]|uniref:AbiH family protein n=1 Tax=Fusobacterium sp. MFO224 TaxID=3378070 RepID=UPI0038522FE2